MKKPGAVFIRRTKEYIREHNMIKPGSSVVAAVSAGSDSLSMLLVLSEIQQELDFKVIVAHFNHQLREESADEAVLVENLCKKLEIPFYLGTAPVRELATGDNLEAVARRLRYDFFREVAKKVGASKIATAHHGDDQCETLFMHLIRGCGMEGLSAIAPVEGDIIRPFLCFTKNQIMMFCIAQNAYYAVDESNFSEVYTRNYLRMDIIPELEEINPRLTEATMSTAEICRAENEYMSRAAYDAYGQSALINDWGLNEKIFKGLHLSLKRRVLRLAYEKYAGSVGVSSTSLSFEQTQKVLEMREGLSLPLPKSIWVTRREGNLIFSREKLENTVFMQINGVQCGGIQELANWGWEYEAKYLSSAERESALATKLTLDCMLVPASLLPRLSFRTRRDGDFIYPAGMEGRKKVKNIFIDKKIPPIKRASWPLLLLDDEVVWLPGLRRGKLDLKAEELVLIICHPS